MEENRDEELREEASEESLKETSEETGEASAGAESQEVNNTELSDGTSQESAEETRQETSDADENVQGEDAEAEEEQDEDDASQDEEIGDNEAAESQGQGENVRRGLFGKKKKDKRDQQIEELTDRVQRQLAEFDNFRKRSEKEKSAMYEIGAKSVIEKILPTIDNFERGFAGLTDEQKEDPFVQGMEKVYRQMMTTLEGIGVTPIEAVGKPFDPNFHNAVMHVEDEEAEENVVVEEFQRGYLYRDAVVRHSMVKVAN